MELTVLSRPSAGLKRSESSKGRQRGRRKGGWKWTEGKGRKGWEGKARKGMT